MKKFIQKIFLFMLIITLLLEGTRQIQVYKSNTVKSYDYLMEKGLDTEILVMGNSHAYWGVNPTFFSMKTLNLAYNNRPFSQDLDILEKVMNSLPELKVILLPADYFTLYFNGSDNYNRLNSVHFRLIETDYLDYYRHLKWCKFSCSKYPNEIDLLGYAPHNDSLSTRSYEEKEEQGSIRVSSWNNEWLVKKHTKRQ